MRKKKIMILSAAAVMAVSACTIDPQSNVPEDVYGPPSDFEPYDNDVEEPEEQHPEEEGYEETIEEENR